MVAKKAVKSSASVTLAATIKESGQEIWLAGLGAFSKAQAEGGKVFEALVNEGKVLQSKIRDAAGNVAGKITETRVTELPEKAAEGLAKMGQLFEDRTAEALGRCGVATKKDIDMISRRVAKLATEMEKVKLAGVKSVTREAKAQGQA